MPMSSKLNICLGPDTKWILCIGSSSEVEALLLEKTSFIGETVPIDLRAITATLKGTWKPTVGQGGFIWNKGKKNVKNREVRGPGRQHQWSTIFNHVY